MKVYDTCVYRGGGEGEELWEVYEKRRIETISEQTAPLGLDTQ